jgi:hypothetical protein
MPKQVSTLTDNHEVTTNGATEDDSQQPSRNLDLNDLADRMDGDARSRAVQRILSHHAFLRADIDRLCAKVGSQAETIAQLESRLALVEEDGEAEEGTPMGKRRGVSKEKEAAPAPTDYTKPENDRRAKAGFWNTKLYFGEPRRKSDKGDFLL